MDADGSVTRWIHQLKAGDRDAAEALWEKYFRRMVGLAQRRLEHAPRRAADEEDVALSAFNSFCTRAKAGLFPRLTDRDNLWPLLIAITGHKCVDLIRRENRLKRRRTEQAGVDLEALLSQEPTPEFALEVADQLDHLLRRLDATGDAELRPIALWKMEGVSTGEIALRLGCVRRTVERKLTVIVGVWEREGGGW
jgi:DNA-directed RNA polymerase specialized sigma24 family protein